MSDIDNRIKPIDDVISWLKELNEKRTHGIWMRFKGGIINDTQLADIDRALRVLRPMVKLWESDEDKKGERFISLKDCGLAHQTYTELRETYPKEEKDG